MLAWWHSRWNDIGTDPQNQATENLRCDTNKAVQSLRVTRCMVQIAMRLCPNRKGKTTRYQRKIYMCMRLTIIKTLFFNNSISLHIKQTNVVAWDRNNSKELSFFKHYQIIWNYSKQSFTIAYFIFFCIKLYYMYVQILEYFKYKGLSKKIIFFSLALILFTFISTLRLSCFTLDFHARRKKIRKISQNSRYFLANSTQNPRYFHENSTQISHVTCEIPRS